MSKQPLPTFINDADYLTAWRAAVARAFCVSLSIEPPTAGLIHAHGRPACEECWDTGLCPECLGQYPQYCPNGCAGGTCSCVAGQARHAHQEKMSAAYV